MRSALLAASLLLASTTSAQVPGVVMPNGGWLPCSHPLAASQAACQPVPAPPTGSGRCGSLDLRSNVG